jgi:hypothetical protein
MKFIKQTFKHDPANGVYGDCYPTCLSIVTGIDREYVPHWHEAMNGSEADERFAEWMDDVGLFMIRHWYRGDMTPDEVLVYIGAASPRLPYILSGFSANGFNHAVVAHGAKIVWDPSQNDSGIVGPMATEPERCYCAEWIVRKPRGLRL